MQIKHLLTSGCIWAVVLAISASAGEGFSNHQSANVGGDRQSDTLVQVEKAHRFHHSGIAGQVLLVPVMIPDKETAPYQATLTIFVERFNRIHQIGQITTAADGTFFLNLPPGVYTIAPVLPQWNPALSSVPITVTVAPRQIAPVEIDVIETGGSIVL